MSHQNVEALHKKNQEINQNWNHIFAIQLLKMTAHIKRNSKKYGC